MILSGCDSTCAPPVPHDMVNTHDALVLLIPGNYAARRWSNPLFSDEAGRARQQAFDPGAAVAAAVLQAAPYHATHVSCTGESKRLSTRLMCS